MPASIAETEREYNLHPSIMDSAFQSTIGLIQEDEDLQNPAIPFALEELIIYDRCQRTMWALVTKNNNNKGEDKLQKVDIDICDESGKVCARIKRLSLRVTRKRIEKNNYDENTLTILNEPKNNSLKSD